MPDRHSDPEMALALTLRIIVNKLEEDSMKEITLEQLALLQVSCSKELLDFQI